MGFKLRILSFWTPECLLKKGLDELAVSTIKGLELLLEEKAKNSMLRMPYSYGDNIILKGDLKNRRIEMCRSHNKLVKTLITVFGYDKAIELGREAMFQEGFSLGLKFKKILGVGNSLEDLIRAARILYNVLGIEFCIEERESNVVMIVNHCSLAEYYDSDTCMILSAADEGVIQGLNSDIKIKFIQKITEGCNKCIASITSR